METVSIRNIRGSALRVCTRRDKPLVITDHQALISIMIPVKVAWVEHIVDYNWARVGQSIAESEQAAATTSPATLDDVIAEADVAIWRSDDASGGERERLASPLAEALIGRTSEYTEIFEWLQNALTPPGSIANLVEPTKTTVSTLRFDEFSPRIIEQAGKARQILALTDDRESVGMVIPFGRDLVKYLLERNISRVLDNIALSEKELSGTDKMTTLDEVDIPQSAALRGELVRLREESGSTQEQVASGLEWSQSKLIRIEGGRSLPTKVDLDALLAIYGVTSENTRERLHALNREARRRDW